MSFTIEIGASTVTIDNPQYNYTVIINMAIKQTKSKNGYFFFDNGSTFDYRIIKGLRHLMNAQLSLALFNYFTVASTARSNVFTLHLGASPTGWFPAGPDKGDIGDFTFTAVNFDQSAMLLNPYKYFNSELELKVESVPSYSLPTEISQGNLQIGAVSGLLYPQSGFSLKYSGSKKIDISQGGTVSNIDLGSTADIHEVSWTQSLNHSKAAALVNDLLVKRSTDISVVTQSGSYFSGSCGGSSGTYTCKNLNAAIEIAHVNFNEFEIPMNFWIESVA